MISCGTVLFKVMFEVEILLKGNFSREEQTEIFLDSVRKWTSLTGFQQIFELRILFWKP